MIPARSAIKVIVIGAGLSGAACAHAFAQRGCEVTILSQGGGASELPVGLLAAHLSAQDIELSQISRIGVSLTLSHARAMLREGLDWQPCELEQKLLFHPEKNARLRQGAALLPDWYEAHDSHVLHKQAAWVKPQALARAWARLPGITQRQTCVAQIKRSQQQSQALNAQGGVIAQADHLVIAAGMQSIALLEKCGHPLIMDAVDGSVAIGAWPSDTDAGLSPLINGNGHFISNVPSENGSAFWLSGSTYERDIHEPPAAQQAASSRANQARLAQLLPPNLQASINEQFAQGQVQSWQSSRCTTSDRFPVVGQLEEGLHVCTAMGSRGLSFAALCAEVLAQEIVSGDSSTIISNELRRELLPSRKTLKVSPP